MCDGFNIYDITRTQAGLGSQVEARKAQGLSRQPQDGMCRTWNVHTRSDISQGPMIVGAQRVTPRGHQVDGLPRAPSNATGTTGPPWRAKLFVANGVFNFEMLRMLPSDRNEGLE